MFSQKKTNNSYFKYIVGGTTIFAITSGLLLWQFIKEGAAQIKQRHDSNDSVMTDPNGNTTHVHSDVHHTWDICPQLTPTCFAARHVLSGKSGPGDFEFKNSDNSVTHVEVDQDPIKASISCISEKIDAFANINTSGIKLEDKYRELFKKSLGDAITKKMSMMSSMHRNGFCDMINNAFIGVIPARRHDMRFLAVSGFTATHSPASSEHGVAMYIYSGFKYSEETIKRSAEYFVDTVIYSLPHNNVGVEKAGRGHGYGR